MDCDYSTIIQHIKGKHLSNELKRGTVSMYRGSVHRYKAKAGQKDYEEHKASSGRRYDFIKKSGFMSYVSTHFFEDGWSLDSCVGRALIPGAFKRS